MTFLHALSKQILLSDDFCCTAITFHQILKAATILEFTSLFKGVCVTLVSCVMFYGPFLSFLLAIVLSILLRMEYELQMILLQRKLSS